MPTAQDLLDETISHNDRTVYRSMYLISNLGVTVENSAEDGDPGLLRRTILRDISGRGTVRPASNIRRRVSEMVL